MIKTVFINIISRYEIHAMKFSFKFCHFQDSNDTKTFTFDFSYWSHDGFKENKEGYFAPESSKYADQTKVKSF